MNYTTSDFTDIRGPEEKPTVPGWYISAPFPPNQSHSRPKTLTNEIMFDYWDGKKWLEYGNDKHCYQSRYWFGLKEKP